MARRIMRLGCLILSAACCWILERQPAAAEASIEEHAYCAAYLDQAASRLESMGDPFISNLRRAASQHAKSASQDYQFVLRSASGGGEFVNVSRGGRFQAEQDVMSWQNHAGGKHPAAIENSAAGRGIARCIASLE